MADLPRQRPHPWQFSWTLSIALHSIAFTSIAASIALAPISPPVSAPTIQVDGRWGATDPVDAATPLRSADADNRWEKVIETSRDQRTLPDASASELSAFVQSQIDRSVADGERRSPSQNQDKLSRLGRRLNETSSPARVDQMADFLGGMVGKRSDAVEPEDPQRPFDPDTAQIDRVRKEDDSRGGVCYIATLIDAHGITTELELDPETGSQLYKTMKLIESNPLLERVYRKIVMGFLDQMLSKPPAK